MKHATIKELIEILQSLPQDALVWESSWHSNEPMDVSDKYMPLKVYEHDGEVRLYVDDGEATHETDEFCDDLFGVGSAWDRILNDREASNDLT